MKIIRRFIASLQLREAVKQADKAYQENNHRYFVMPSSGLDGKLIILDRNNFRGLKQKGYIDKNVSVKDLVRESFYYTPNAGGNDALPEYGIKVKAQSFFNWKEAIRLKKKHLKKMK